MRYIDGDFPEDGDPSLPSLHAGPDFKERLDAYVRMRGLRVWRDPDEMRWVVREVFHAYPDFANALRKGSQKYVGFFMRKVMEATRNGAYPPLALQTIAEEAAVR